MADIAKFRDRPSLTHLKRLTTKDGIVQHADLEVPDPSWGYSIDDNARALIVTLWHFRLYHDPAITRLAEIYFGYIRRAEKAGGSFHNFLSFTEKILDAEGSEDSVGRAIWALGETIRLSPEDEMVEQAKEILGRATIEKHLDHPHVRTKSYILLGLLAQGNFEQAKIWADKLVQIFKESSNENWLWFEGSLRYANGIIPYSLAKAAAALKQDEYLEVAERSFTWLDEVSRNGTTLAPVGSEGWHYKDLERAVYDQQPLEAADMVLAAIALFETTQNPKYKKLAIGWMGWYNGNNTKHVSLLNPQTGGIFDAVTPGGVNKNQGAESIITFLMAYLELSRVTQ